MRARRLEQNRFDEQQALLLLSGLSLTRRRALPSGTSLIRTQFACLAPFSSGVALGIQRARSVPSGFALLHIGVPKGFVLSCSRFVGRSPTESKPKIQGFTLTDKQPAVRLSSARHEKVPSRFALCISRPAIARWRRPQPNRRDRCFRRCHYDGGAYNVLNHNATPADRRHRRTGLRSENIRSR